jgi:O-antigen/teichoic acid export membrane protein
MNGNQTSEVFKDTVYRMQGGRPATNQARRDLNRMADAPTHGLPLRKNVAWISAGEGVDLISQWGLLAVLSKLMDVGAVGLFGLAMAVIVPVTQLFDLGLRKAQATDVAREYQFNHYFSLRVVTSSVALLLIILVGSALGVGAYGWTVVFLMALAKVIEGQSDVFHGLFQHHSRMDYIARARMLRGPLGLTLFTLGILVTGDQRVASLGLIVAAFTVLLLNDVRLSRRFLTVDEAEGSQGNLSDTDSHKAIAFVWDTKRMSALVHQVLPLGIVALLASLQMNIPRYSLEYQQGLEALGYFTAISVMYSATARMANAVAHSASASMARGFAAAERRKVVVLYGKLGIMGLLLGAGGVFAVMIMGREILTFLYTEAYADYADVLVLVMVAAAIRHLGSVWQLGIVAARRFRLHLMQYIGNISVTAVASVLLIGPYGVAGAAYVLIVVALFNLAVVTAINAYLLRNLSHGN